MVEHPTTNIAIPRATGHPKRTEWLNFLRKKANTVTTGVMNTIDSDQDELEYITVTVHVIY